MPAFTFDSWTRTSSHGGATRLARATVGIASCLFAALTPALGVGSTAHPAGPQGGPGVGKVFDPDAHILEKLSRRAIMVVAAREHLPPSSLVVAYARVARYPALGFRSFAYKLEDTSTTRGYGVELDQTGLELDVPGLEQAERDAAHQLYGKLDPRLAEILVELGPNDRVSVDVWLHTVDAPPAARPTRQASLTEAGIDAWLAQRRAERAQLVAVYVEPLVAALHGAGFEAYGGKYSPAVSARLSRDWVLDLAQLTEVRHIYLVGRDEPELDDAAASVDADDVWAAGFNGAGVKVSQIEIDGGSVGTGIPFLPGVIQDLTYACWSLHARQVACIIASTHSTYTGIANGCSLWAGGSCDGSWSERKEQSDGAVFWGANVMNLSWGGLSNGNLNSRDHFYDDLVFHTGVTAVNSAGNEGNETGWVTSPGLGYNVLTVGNYNDQGTETASDDNIASSSSFRDPGSKSGDREKPEVAAPGKTITVTANDNSFPSGSGTSLSAAVVSGAAALVMDQDAWFRIWPEAVKAVLMATAFNNVSGPQGELDDKDGSGGITCKRAMNLVNYSSGDANGRGYTCSDPDELVLTSMSLTAGKRVRVVIAWAQDEAYSSYERKPCADLDLRVLSSAGTTVDSSLSYDNNYEFVDFVPAFSGTYTIRVDEFRCSRDPAYLAWAWYEGP